MNHGPLIFLAGFFALATSWFGFVLTPQMQVGQLQQTNTVPSGATYPVARAGLARQGLEVYRANGCVYCHSQQIGQSGTFCEVVLNEPGTNQVALLKALLQVSPGLTPASAGEMAAGSGKTVLKGLTREAAEAALKTLSGAGAKASISIVPFGPDLARGWGKRRTVAEDFLFDYPVMLGSIRIGPDLANIGVRQPDLNWHLLHLYLPTLQVKGSSMPPYRFLFEKRRIERRQSSEALVLPANLAPEPGYEIVPKPEARALAAYLTSLRAEAPLYVAPLTAPAPVAATTKAAATASAK